MRRLVSLSSQTVIVEYACNESKQHSLLRDTCHMVAVIWLIYFSEQCNHYEFNSNS